MKIFRNISLLLIGLFISQAIAAQTVLTGVVKDAVTGAPLTGANVYIANSNERALDGNVVDANGQYRLKIPAQADNLTVIFSFVGYKTKRIKYTSQRTINTTLEDESKSFEAISIVAKRVERNQLGLTQKEVTNATQKITLERLETAPVTNIVDALQGSMSNVDILTGADPGSKSTIRIRGTSSFNASSEPLIVLDGVPFPVSIESDFNFATANSDDFGQLLNISPNDLESIEVLKDAAATAVWGSRGSNGVLLINTKKGQKGRIAFSVSTKYEFKKEASTIPLLNAPQYVSFVQDAIWNTLNDIGYSNSSYTKLLYDTKEIGFDPSWEYFDEYNQNTDWVNEVTRSAYSSDSNVTISGGGEKTDYRLSLGYLNETGTAVGTAFNRFSMMFNIRYKFSNKLRVSTDFNFSQGNRDGNWSGDGVGSARSIAIKKMPNMTPYAIDAYGNRTSDYFTPLRNFQGDYASSKMYNPVALVNESVNRSMEYSNRVVFNVIYTFFQGFEYNGTLGLDIKSNKSRGFLPQSVTGVNWTDPNFNKSFDNMSDTFYLNTDNRFIFRRDFGQDHRVTATAGWRTEDQNSSSYSSGVSGNPSGSMIDPVTGGKVATIGSGYSQFRALNGNVNVHYTLFDKYMFNAAYNIEGSSAMAPNTRWGGFPSFGVAWQLGDEKFMESIKAISLAKVRLSWGQTGNPPSGTGAYFGTYKAMGSYMDMPAIEADKMQLNNLEWELITQTNLGLDLDFFEGKMSMAFDVYNKVTDNLLQRKIGIPTSTGYSDVAYYNSGKMTNRGWEYRIDYSVVRKKDISFDISFNIAQNENKINNLPSNSIGEEYKFGNGNYASKVVVGNPIGSFYGYKYLGVYQNTQDTYMKDANGSIVNDITGKPVVMKNNTMRVYPGDAKYQDVNGDGKIDQYDIVYLGNANPTVTGGFSFNFRYKGWGLVGSLHGRAGQKAVNRARMNMENMTGTSNQSTAVLGRWRNEGDQTQIPRALYGRGLNYLGSDRFVEDASFLRLKTLTLKYSLPRELLAKTKLTQLQVYVTAYDLWTLTKYTGQDPEVAIKGGMYPIAEDNAMTPKPVRISAGITVKF